MRIQRLAIFTVLAGAIGLAQEPPPPPAAPPAPSPAYARPVPVQRPSVRRAPRAPEPPVPPQPPLERTLGGPRGRWWTRPEMVQRLNLTADQKKRMDDIFQQNRLRLIDLNAAVQKEEVIMEPLVSADQPDEARIVAQIDKVAQARAELEKANARMLLGIRRVLTPEQWEKLKSQPTPPQPPEPARAPNPPR